MKITEFKNINVGQYDMPLSDFSEFMKNHVFKYCYVRNYITGELSHKTKIEYSVQWIDSLHDINDTFEYSIINDYNDIMTFTKDNDVIVYEIY